MKVCSKCQVEQPVSAFRIDRRFDRPKSWCRMCDNAYQREYAARNRDAVRERKRLHMAARRADPRTRESVLAAGRRAYANGGHERQRARLARKKADFFRWRVQFIQRHNPAITAAQIEALWDQQEGRCGLTGRPLIKEQAELDHVIPRTRGGSSDLENLRWVCVEANRAKRDLLDDEFLTLCGSVVEWLGRRLMEANGA
jgi:5-methylcytosine-specific restriction endonuclease McrA